MFEFILNPIKLSKIKFNIKSYYLISLKHIRVSIICASIDYSIFIVFSNQLHVRLFLAQMVSIAIASSFGFLGHSYFTYQNKNPNKTNLILFAIQLIIVYMLSIAILYSLKTLNVKIEIAKIIQLIITFIFNVIFGKTISFKNFN
jgi:putative flippase GtrA